MGERPGWVERGQYGYFGLPHNRCFLKKAACRIHVVFHGCMQTPHDIGDQYYTDTGYNRWADTNNMLVLYPQASADLPENKKHCWDWWGDTGLQFNVKAGPQMSAVKANDGPPCQVTGESMPVSRMR